MGEQWVEDDGSLVGPPDEAEEFQDIVDAAREVGITVHPPVVDEPRGKSLGDATLDAVLEVVLPALAQFGSDLDAIVERLDELEEHLIYIEHEWGIGGSTDALEMLPPADTPDIATLDRPLTPAEDKARAAEIARIAKLDAAETEAADLRGIDQAAPDAPVLPPVEDEVVIPVRGPKSGFR